MNEETVVATGRSCDSDGLNNAALGDPVVCNCNVAERHGPVTANCDGGGEVKLGCTAGVLFCDGSVSVAEVDCERLLPGPW